MASGAIAEKWLCPKCGRFDWRVSDSRFKGEVRERQRECKNCHAIIETKEVPVPNGFMLYIVPIPVQGG